MTPGERALWAMAGAERVIAWSMAAVAVCLVVLTAIVVAAAAPAIRQWIRDLIDGP